MAQDIIGNEITPGTFVVWLQARKLVPLFCNAQNQFQGISPSGRVVRVVPRTRSKYVTVTREAMQRLLLRNPLPDNLYVFVNRWRRNEAFGQRAAESRRARVNAFYQQFIGGNPTYATPPAPVADAETRHRQALNAALAHGTDVAVVGGPIRRPILALPQATPVNRAVDSPIGIYPPITQNPAPGFPGHVPPSRGPRTETTITFTNSDGEQETVQVSGQTEQKKEKPTNRQPSPIDLDFD